MVMKWWLQKEVQTVLEGTTPKEVIQSDPYSNLQNQARLSSSSVHKALTQKWALQMLTWTIKGKCVRVISTTKILTIRCQTLAVEEVLFKVVREDHNLFKTKTSSEVHNSMHKWMEVGINLKVLVIEVASGMLLLNVAYRCKKSITTK